MSKRIIQHPEEPASGRKYWRSLGQTENTPEFRGWLDREFPQGASEMEGGEVSRRSFLQLMGASMALAGLSFAGCRRPEKHLVPFTRGVEWSIPGKPLYYATAMPSRSGYQPLIAETYDGRPTKLDGNPLHPASLGASDIYAQAAILNLYDPDRARYFVTAGAKSSAVEFEKALDELIKGAGDGEGLAFLLEENPSPSRNRLRTEIEKKFPKALWAEYEPVGGSASVAAAESAFGEGVAPKVDFSQADVVLTLDCDFLGTDGTNADSRAFANRRKVEGGNVMNRLYVVENRYTVTGGMADHRLRLAASQVGGFLLALASKVAALTKDGPLGAILQGAPEAAALAADWIKPCAEDLVAHKGKAAILVGPRQSPAVQALAHAINAALGAIGKTVVGQKVALKKSATIADLSRELGDKKIKTLVILGGNPVYNAPADLDFASKVKYAGTVIRLGFYEDETAPSATWHAPMSHFLESWGDGYATDGSYVSVQPMILPLYDGWSELELLAKFAGLPRTTGPELVQETFRQIAKPADFTVAWAKFLHDGFVEKSAAPLAPLTLNGGAVTQLVKEKIPLSASGDDTFEIVLTADSSVDDGRYANNGWLQECPDPITKLTWDNAAWISPKSAKKLSVKDGDMIEVSVDGAKIEIPVLVAPGHADQSLTIPLGYGRTEAGRVGSVAQTSEKYVFGDQMISGGFNAYPLTTSAAPYLRIGAKVRVTGKSYRLAITQEHGSLEGRGGDLVREGTLDQLKSDPDFAKTMGMDSHIPPNRSLYSHPPLNDIHQWGMTIDLNTCVGCGSCMVACQAENNIPVVGKRQVIDGREMHWIRCDRYFASGPESDPSGKSKYDQDVEEPEMVSQPMMCQQCENAPCETVCPVNATVHSEDGLNVMAYNRCIGTRYCANNCPFKVRRFNFFDYNQRHLDSLRKWNLVNEKGTEDAIKLSKNPNVTVRMRGVMEKCTFCVQRIQEAKIAAKVAARDSADVKIPTDSFDCACAQCCPTGAITFGDIKDPESKVSKIRAGERAYELLKYLNVGSRILYLARIRNPNPNMPGAGKVASYSQSAHGHGGDHGKHETHGATH